MVRSDSGCPQDCAGGVARMERGCRPHPVVWRTAGQGVVSQAKTSSTPVPLRFTPRIPSATMSACSAMARAIATRALIREQVRR